jgi:polyhydroxybutyrate depolymerase
VGCGNVAAETGINKNVTLKVGLVNRTFIRVVNANYSSTRKHALVIGFHGYGLNGNSPRNDHKWPQIEQMAGDEAIFLYPNSLGPSWDASALSGDLAFFDEMINSSANDYCIDKNRVFVHGFSNGAYFVNGLAAARNASIRGVISVAGGGAGTSKPAIVIHGKADSSVGYWGNAPTLIGSYATANGCNTTANYDAMRPETCTPIDGCPEGHSVLFCPWNGNHHWPEFTLPDVWKFISSFQ